MVEPFRSGCIQRLECEQRMKRAVNAERKAIQKELDSIKNKQLGPKWNDAFQKIHTLQRLQVELQEKEQAYQESENPSHAIQPVVDFLVEMGYLQHPNLMTLTNSDLGLKGMLATEINEGHPILMTELYQSGLLHSLTGQEVICVLACFQEKKEQEHAPSIEELAVSTGVRNALRQLNAWTQEWMALEQRVGSPIEGYWNTSTQMIEPIRRWMEGEHASVICAEYELFEGNLIRSVMRIANVVEEWLSLATYCQHTEEIEKIRSIQPTLLREVVLSDSLYLRL